MLYIINTVPQLVVENKTRIRSKSQLHFYYDLISSRQSSNHALKDVGPLLIKIFLILGSW